MKEVEKNRKLIKKSYFFSIEMGSYLYMNNCHREVKPKLVIGS